MTEPSSRPQPRPLRFHLLRIVIVAVAPLLVFSIISAVLFAFEERRILRRGAMERTLAVLTAIDTELKRSVAALEVLGASESLESGDLDAFRSQAQRVLASRPDWLNIHVAPPSGIQVLNLLRPDHAQFHGVVDRKTFEEVTRTNQPVIGNLFREPYTGVQVFPVRVPIRRQGELRYVLTALVKPGVVHELLLRQELPADWVGGVLDNQHRIVARTIDQKLVGQPASDSLRAALASEDTGWFHGNTIEGWPVYTSFHRSSFSHWSMAMGIPAQVVEATSRRSLAALAVLGAALLGSGLALAGLLAERNVRSLRSLGAMAQDLGWGKTPDDTAALRSASSPVAEIENLRKAFLTAAELIRARSEERDRVEGSLRRAQAQLREAEERKDEFLAMLGHELRNPLGVIVTAIQLLREYPPDDDRAAETRAMIERQVGHMTRLIDDLLDVARIGEGRIQMDRKLCDWAAIVRDTVEDHRELFERNGLTIEGSLPEEPLWVMGDRTRLSQTVGNVLQNARKYTERGGTVRVRLWTEDRGAVLEIRDSGVGMEPEILEHAFEPFRQADRTLDRSSGGLGLGLALVRGLIDLHGGSVDARSQGPGTGSTIAIRLPLASGPPPAVERTGPASPATMPPRRILVIEDNRDAADSLQLYLSRLGHTVQVAHTGPDGVEAARSFHPEVVLCDIGLPGMDGYEVALNLRRSEPGIRRLVATSGYGQESDRRRAQAAGFDDHLTKPIDLEALKRILSEVRDAR